MRDIFVDRWDDLRGFWVFVIVIVAVIGLSAGVAKVVDTIEGRICERKAELYTELDVRYIHLGGCYIDAGEKWVRIADFEQYYGDMHTLQIGEVGE